MLRHMTTPATQSLEHLFPTAGNNAIDTAAIVLSWAGQRDDQLHAPFLEWQSGLSELGYAAPASIDAVEVAINQGAVLESRSTARVGYVYIKKNSNGIPIREISLRDNQFIFSVRDYTRWDKFKSDASYFLDKILQILQDKNKTIVSVSLQYQDKFQWRSIDTKFPTKKILRDTAFLPLDRFDSSEQWHNNQGFFVDSRDPLGGKRLDNINLSLAVDNNVPTLGILIVHQYGSLGISGDDLVASKLWPMLEVAHSQNKKYLQEILAESVCNKIGIGRS